VPILIDEDNQKAWISVAHSTRINERILSRIGDPLPGSNFAKVAELFPFERVSDRARAYLRAGLDHLVMWADFAAPFKFHQDQVLNFTLRPTYTLSRAAIEASAQAVWLMDTRDPKECIRRHLSLMRWDLNEHHRSKKGDPSEQAMIDVRRRELVNRVSAVFQPEEHRATEGLPAGHQGCLLGNWPGPGRRHRRAPMDRSQRCRTRKVLDQPRPADCPRRRGVRARPTPDCPDPRPLAMTEVLEAANKITGYGVLRFADYSGVGIESFIDEAVAWLAQNIPLRDEAARAEMDRLRALIDRRSRRPQEP
jgi:hypothetical protein